MIPQDLVEKLRAAHETLDGMRADLVLDVEYYYAEKLEPELKKIAECIDALVKAGEEGR
ncbi:hypothetical protein LCGC14_1447550 [marine sediment metagenome]|uniref:Uncharacterized protein n=1 Tax=marine sediment metagenome TaxID=412755 RepID=A0A0F9JIV4_9ZZZZ